MFPQRVLALVIVLVLALYACDSLYAQSTVRVAAASDLRFVFPDIAAEFEKQTGNKLAVTYGSSGSFFAQIQNGAPFDLFFSADADLPRKLVAAGMAEADSFAIYGYGTLVLWLPANSPIDPAEKGLKTLLDPRIRKIAIANPDHAPYGRQAVAALQKAGLYDQVKSKLVYGENVSQAAQFVESGSAQAGLIPCSLAGSPQMKRGKQWKLPQDAFPPNEQAAVILKSALNKAAAASLIAFLRSSAGRTLLENHCIQPPHGAAVRPKP